MRKLITTIALLALVDTSVAIAQTAGSPNPAAPPSTNPDELSDRGRSLKLALAPIGRWVMENQTDIEEARERLREQSPEDSAVVDD